MEITYQLTKKQDFFQKNIGTFVKQKITSRVKEIDQAEEFPPEVMADLAGNRLLGLLVPKEEGGEGAGFLDLCLALEGVGRICPTSALVCSVQNLGAWLLSKRGTPAQKEKYLSDIMAGGAIFGYALPDVLSLDPLKVSLSASKDNEGFILSGPECFVINGDVSKVICLFAKEEDSVHGFMVGKDARGLKAARSVGMAGAEARITCKVVLENCRVPKDSLMGEGGDGKEIMVHMVNAASCFTAARALGLEYYALKKRVVSLVDGSESKPSGGFVEFAPSCAPPFFTEWAVELEKANGARMRVAVRSPSDPDVVGLCRAFWGEEH